MCRYAQYSYKEHYACFRCRKQFKRRNARDVGHDGPDKPAICPQCGLLMASMGLDFKPPPMRDVDAWRRVEGLFEIGVTFHSCGCSGPGYRPRGQQEYRAFLLEKRAEYQAEVEHWARGGPEGLTRWKERLANLDRVIAQEGV